VTTIDLKFDQPQVREVVIADGPGLAFRLDVDEDTVWVGERMKVNRTQLTELINGLTRLRDRMNMPDRFKQELLGHLNEGSP